MKARPGQVLCLTSAILLVCCFQAASAPETAADHFRLGRLLGEAGDMQAAAKEFRAAIRLQSGYAEAHYFLALTSIATPTERLNWPEAASECRLALASRPNYPEALHLLGVSLAAMGRQSEAVEQFRKALQLRPNYPEAHLELGMAYAALLRNDEAIAEYRQAIASRPQYAAAHERLGKCLFQQGKLADAQAELATALKINPDLADTHYLLARVLLALHQKTAAEIEFREVNQLHSRGTLATESVRLSNAGLAAARRGDFAAAVQSLEEAVRKKPDSAVAHYNLGLVLADAGHLDWGIIEVRKAISLAPLEKKMQASLGRMLARTGSVADKAECPQPDTSTRHLKCGKLLASKGDQLGAIGEYLRALALAPNNIDARNALAQAYRASGDLDNAELEMDKLKLMQSGTVTP
jgi:tetratricopeptide (TPR) repeat protein